MASRKRCISAADTGTQALHKEWDEALCPICMEHPHNAVMIVCSSYEKGCRSYICDTSYRHSNCLDRFKNLRAENENNTPSLSNPSLDVSNLPNEGESLSANPEVQGDDAEEVDEGCPGRLKTPLRCPMCRGTVLGWKFEEDARSYMNLKPRSCSCESCSFFGNYRELRRHARRAHPMARPSNVDPSRQQAWRSLERQREYADIVSAIRSAMPGAVVFGDFVIENGDREAIPTEREIGSGDGNGPWWTTYFYFEMVGTEPRARARARARAWSGHRRSSATSSRRRYLWGENLLGLQDDDDDDNEEDDEVTNVLSDAGEDLSPVPRRRRRLTRSLSDEDQQ